MSNYSVHDEPDFARVYDEDETVTVRKGDIRAMLDALDMNLGMASNALDEEETEACRSLATAIGLDPIKVTPQHLLCKYQQPDGQHDWQKEDAGLPHYRCSHCRSFVWEKP